ncbi:hypothetical protein ACFC0X_23240 [Paenibacillus chitinolyticus]|uniref:hypothetical protein n=1 Tax=Paenibacillus chitinolyticus TaxID=79263 RepID=UPI0035E2FDBE
MSESLIKRLTKLTRRSILAEDSDAVLLHGSKASKPIHSFRARGLNPRGSAPWT